jgi:hypothetical protein
MKKQPHTYPRVNGSKTWLEKYKWVLLPTSVYTVEAFEQTLIGLKNWD